MFAISFALAFALTPLVIFLLRRFKMFDVPTERSSHVVRTARGGGLAVAAAAIIGVVLAGTAGVVESWSMTTLLVCTSFFALVGFIDDIRTLDVKPRLACQFGCAAVFVGPWFFANAPIDNHSVALALAVLGVIWVMGFLNAFNFMDGINGISGLHAALAGVVFAVIGHVQDHRIISICGLAVAGAALGFLPFNFPRAWVFLGDVGSYFLGTWLAITALIALVWAAPPEAVVGPFIIYLADTAYTLFDRISRGEDWKRSHHDHVYQRLIEMRWSHTLTALTVLGFSVVCVALGMVSLTSSLEARLVADFALVPVVIAYLALPEVVLRRRLQAESRRSHVGMGPGEEGDLAVAEVDRNHTGTRSAQ